MDASKRVIGMKSGRPRLKWHERAGGGGVGEWPAWLGFEPDARQAELLRREVKRLVLNCTRQWGKSTITAAKAVDRAVRREGSLEVAGGAVVQAGVHVRVCGGGRGAVHAGDDRAGVHGRGEAVV